MNGTRTVPVFHPTRGSPTNIGYDDPPPPHPPPGPVTGGCTGGTGTNILFTVAVVEPVFPTASTKSKVNDPFDVKVKVLDPELFVIVIGSDAPVRVATTDPLVARRVE